MEHSRALEGAASEPKTAHLISSAAYYLPLISKSNNSAPNQLIYKRTMGGGKHLSTSVR